MNDEQLRDQLEGLFSDLADSAQDLVKEPQDSERATPQAEVGEDDPLIGLLATGYGQDAQLQRDALPQPAAPAGPSSFTTPRKAVPRRRVNWPLIIWVVLGTLAMAAIVLMSYRHDNLMASIGQPAAGQPAATAKQPGLVLPPTPTPSLTPSPAPTTPSKSVAIPDAAPSATPSPDVATDTPTPTPTYVIITSTPTPLNIATAMANSLRMTAEAERVGAATPLPPNWVTPMVVTSTPTPENAATAEHLKAVALTTGTPKPLPDNAVTATPTPVFVLLDGEIPTPAAPGPTATPRRFIPAELVGKIAFLSDRAHHANAGTVLAEGQVALPLGKPLVYVMDPDGGDLALLSDRWPYDLAQERDAFAADQRYRVFVKDAEHWENGRRKMRPALYFFDFLYEAEEQITHFGGGIAYDPAWSPTSEQITFVSNDSGNDEIWVINRDGGGALQLTRDPWNWWDKHPSWSPDGSKIVFWSNRTGNRQIWVMDADGSNLHSLSRTGFNDWDPVWIKYTDPPPALGE